MATRSTPSPVGSHAARYHKALTHVLWNHCTPMALMAIPIASIASDSAGFHQLISSSSPCSWLSLQQAQP